MYVALHNSFSSKQVEEFAKVVFGMGLNTIIFTKASSSAAQNGVPIVQKMAIKNNKNLMYLEGLEDAIELLNPEKVIMITNSGVSKEKLNFEEIGEKDLIVFCGSNSGFSLKEIEATKGSPKHILDVNIGPIGEASILLYNTLK
ncbi:RecB-family nuclease [Methanococcus voltae]|uniref:SpoU rRNA methylase family enzyme n=2 Tax=Methanococcus voltae TaxID=2188 RepID=A0A8J7URJ5_METVO|nr:RecB-family nuclease [Methanococcus voltae]MBP2172722.1 SpoU rRNA methylase family enzyme [Methanococcus voltae]MBP2201868.1 SpoU rRNA methylase family enzyme [Methanococcus voltae]MCS3922692.1 SpoU rRNA methylase family enzyme [Methanococcus voltae PS]